MGFRINTNIAAMDAHRNSLKTNAGLDKSLASLSSGLRINKAADDASGMVIADSLRSQAQGLGQAINNANDGVAVVQTADGALDEYVNIINIVRTKSIQAASDGQNTDSRQAIQADIDRLLEAANGISKTTQFNGQKLLDGSFTNKAFHIGAYAGETVNLSVASVKTADVGSISSVNNDASHTTKGKTAWAALSGGNFTASSNGNVLKENQITINGQDVTESLSKLSPTRTQDARSLANAITDATGILAQGTTMLEGTAVSGGALSGGDTLTINGISVDVAGRTFSAADSNGALVRAINDTSDQSGVKAENKGGKLVLTASDGRNISVGGSAGALSAAGLTDNVTTLSGGNIAGLSAANASSLTIAEGELILNGKDMAGTYGDGATSGSAAQQFLNAVKNIDGFSTSTLSAAGELKVNVNNGDDLNASGSDVATYLAASSILNTSEKGVVNIFSDKDVTVAVAQPKGFGFDTGKFTPKGNDISLESIDVTNRESAEVAILISDSALKQLDKTRADLGSVQNQLESTIRNISVTQVNVASAESQIRDVDFAAESANFAKFNILAQSGSYAMSQANAVQQNVMRLLQ